MVQRSFMDKFVIQLRYHREDKGLSQCELAEKLKIGLRSYQRYEAGESIPSIDLLFTISQALDFNLKDFFAPDEYLKHINGLKFYDGAEVKEFTSHPLIVDSELISFFESKEFQKVIDTDNIKLLRNNKFFQSSSYHINVSSPKYRILSPVLKHLTQYNTDIISATTCFNYDIRLLGSLWSTLIDKKQAFYDIITYPVFPSGNYQMRSKYLYKSSNYHYYVVGISEPHKL